MIRLVATPAGVQLPVRARAGARQEGIHGAHDGRLKVSGTEAPEKGRANLAIARLLAEALGVPPPRVRLLPGHRSSRKTFLIQQLAIEDCQQRLQSHLSS